MNNHFQKAVNEMFRFLTSKKIQTLSGTAFCKNSKVPPLGGRVRKIKGTCHQSGKVNMTQTSLLSLIWERQHDAELPPSIKSNNETQKPVSIPRQKTSCITTKKMKKLRCVYDPSTEKFKETMVIRSTEIIEGEVIHIHHHLGEP
jgi:hypothetical protein